MKQQSQDRGKPQAESKDYSAGSVVAGKYRLLHPLGEGGMGSVWAAHSSALDINVALKLIRLDTAHEEAPLRLVQEARATARLADPGIVRMFDVGCTERGDPFIAMELLTGTTLQQTLEAGPLPAVRAVRLLLPIVRGLETAHRAGVVHRDIKPDNILFAVGARGDLQPKLVDFGVAKLLSNDNKLTHVGAVVGSPQYMSPEQARGEVVDARSDLWSMCVVLYETTVGAPPFTAKNTHALLYSISAKQFEWGAEPAGADPILAQIIRKGLANEREERWQHARELLLALAEWLRSQGVTEDIAGVALRGRGLGEKSSLPGPPIELSSSARYPRPGTALHLAGVTPREGADAIAGPASSPDAVELGARAGAPAERSRHSRRVWQGAVAALCVLGLLLAVALSRSAVRGTPIERLPTPSATAAPAVLSVPSAEPKPSAAEPAEPAEPAAAVTPSPMPAANRRGREPATPRKAPPRAKLVAPAPAPRATPAPFKNPFE